MIILDANILLYAYSETSPHSSAARTWLQERITEGAAIGIPWMTALAFLRIASNVRAYRMSASLPLAIARLDELLQRPNVALIYETPMHWKTLKSLLIDGQATGNYVMDAHLAALAVEHGAELCTNDRDFTRFAGLRLINPVEQQ
jgi:uncharacterized protein